MSVPDMGYFVTDTRHGVETDASGTIINEGIPCIGRGEICFRGHNVFSGYYKEPEKTAEVLPLNDGWLHSGDIGLWDEFGNLRVIDRKKNIFKLSQGEYIAAEKLENVYLRCGLVGQVFVHGDSLHSLIIGVVVSSEDGARAWAKANNRSGDAATLRALCADADFNKAVLDGITAVSKESRLQGFEIVKAVILDPTPWTPETILTPSFKLKRTDARKLYEARVRRREDGGRGPWRIAPSLMRSPSPPLTLPPPLPRRSLISTPRLTQSLAAAM